MKEHRSELQGLRAVAVIAVILYHAEFAGRAGDWFTGGFVGVDIFFVLSGYLISGIIFREISETGNVRLGNFYTRRAKRILPALLFVTISSTLFAFFFLLPREIVDLAKSQIASSFFVSNFYFYYSATEYGAAPALLMPFLHTWSLGVEWQFYLVFPLVALAISRAAPRHMGKLIAMAALCSLIACVATRRVDPQYAFFMPFTRAWELLAGSLLSLYEARRGRITSSVVTQAMASISLLAVLLPIPLFGKFTEHPGVITIIPVAGTVTLLAVMHSNDIVGRVISFPPLRYLGDISYSLYLWHFSIFAFWRVFDSDFTSTEKLIAVTATVALSIVSYHVIEEPFRRMKELRFLRLSGLTLTASVFIAVSVVVSDGFPLRLNGTVPPSAFQRERDLIASRIDFIGEAAGAKPVIYIVGDSYVRNWSVALNKFIDHEKYDVVSITYLGCTINPEGNVVKVETTSGAKYEENCRTFDRFINDRNLISRTYAVFLTSHRPFEYDANKFRFKLLKWMQSHGPDPEIFIFGNYFQMNQQRQPSCVGLMFRKNTNASKCLELADYPPPEFNPKVLPQYPADLPFTYIDIIALSCSATRSGCRYESGGMPFMEDWNHLTATFLIEMWGLILKSKCADVKLLGLNKYLELRKQ